SCPTTTWDEAILKKTGHIAGLSMSDPVNMVSGNYSYSEVDLTLKSRMPLTLARIYNSLDATIGSFGSGWSSPYFSRLEFVASDVLFINSDGSR
ncbi:MAG: DUF6531 domain-containing protein, partial [Ignavibacteria bacterium]|nr:DUF6531 domain-containing protein [Ignavibacteria bacterium]